MNPKQILGGLFVLSLGINTWYAVRAKFAPFPSLYVRSGLGFGVISLLAIASPELASALGVGYIIVDFIRLNSIATGQDPSITYQHMVFNAGNAKHGTDAQENLSTYLLDDAITVFPPTVGRYKGKTGFHGTSFSFPTFGALGGTAPSMGNPPTTTPKPNNGVMST